MYKEHVPEIAAGMRDDPEIFARGVLFAALSARQAIQHVPVMLRDVDRNGSDAEALALPNKWNCWNYLQDRSTALWRSTTAYPLRETEAALKHLVIVPGLGIVKAAFVLQFLGHNIGCLDTHNIRREKIPARAFTSHIDPKFPELAGYRPNQFIRYMSLANGRACELWDTWCNQLGPMRGMTGDEISALHLEIIR
jgi:hypothetical protein